MYRFTAEGTVKKIKDPEVCNKTGYVKRVMILENEKGSTIAPEFNPRSFKMLIGLKEGDQVKVEFGAKPQHEKFHYFKVLKLEVI